MQAEADRMEKLATLLKRHGWRVLHLDPLDPEWDWDGLDFLLIGDQCNAMSHRAAWWMNWLMAECPSASFH